MLNIEEVKETTWKKQEENFEKNLADCKEKIDMTILADAEEGYTSSVFKRAADGSDTYFTLGRVSFFLDKRIYKAIKKEYKEAGFKVRKTEKYLEISWYK